MYQIYTYIYIYRYIERDIYIWKMWMGSASNITFFVCNAVKCVQIPAFLNYKNVYFWENQKANFVKFHVSPLGPSLPSQHPLSLLLDRPRSPMLPHLCTWTSSYPSILHCMRCKRIPHSYLLGKVTKALGDWMVVEVTLLPRQLNDSK